jgi:hypothetical protein
MYRKIYDKLVVSRSHLIEEWKNNKTLYRHRIKPGHQGGVYVDDNCTYLTLREHIIAHYLLWKINGHPGDYRAYKWMSGLETPFAEHSEYTKQKLSKSHKGVPLSEEHRKRISDGQRGRVGGFKGKKHTKETIEKMRVSQQGKPMSEEAKAKLSATRKKLSHIINPKKNLGNGMLGKKHHVKTLEKMRGQKRSVETRERLKLAWVRRREALANRNK